VKTKRKHCKITRRFELYIVPGTTNSAVVFNPKIDQEGFFLFDGRHHDVLAKTKKE